MTTVRVTRFTSNYIQGILECGKDHGKSGRFEKIEMQDCQEMFASSVLQAMHSNLSDLEQEDAASSKTKSYPQSVRKLKNEFFCPEVVKYKRIWHVDKLFGKALDLTVERTNMRCQRVMKRSRSQNWKKRWKQLSVGPRLYTILAAWVGSAILGVSPRHLIKRKPW